MGFSKNSLSTHKTKKLWLGRTGLAFAGYGMICLVMGWSLLSPFDAGLFTQQPDDVYAMGAGYDLAVDSTWANGVVNSGDVVLYSITLNNIDNGPDLVANNVIVRDTLPAGVVFNGSWEGTVNGISNGDIVLVSGTTGSSYLEWLVNPLFSTDDVVITYEVLHSQIGTFVNRVEVEPESGALEEDVPYGVGACIPGRDPINGPFAVAGTNNIDCNSITVSSDPILGVCGVDNLQDFYTTNPPQYNGGANSSNLCNSGISSDPSYSPGIGWTWTCIGQNGGSNQNCSANELYCGDTVIQAVGGEVCDDGNQVAGDGCSELCQIEGCMDTDAYNYSGSATVDDGTCRKCGDSVLDSGDGESCDDGNTDGDDGCSSTCEVERIRILQVDPRFNEIKLRNFGTTSVNVGSYLVCSNADCGSSNDIQGFSISNGSLFLAPDAEITLQGPVLNASGADVQLFYGSGSLADSGTLIDYVQWRTDGNEGESLAVSKGIRAGGEFLDENPAFIYIGDGETTGLSQWTDRPTVCGNGEVQIGQACDDGNTVGGDGCSADCLTIESGRTCPILGGVCTDDNECLGEGSGNNCSLDASCSNIPGSFSCACNSGYSGDGVTCTDDNECLGEGSGNNCSADAACANTLGSFTCSCNAGFVGDGVVCSEVCGDGIKTAGEQCDDGNLIGSDGCSADCRDEKIRLVSVDPRYDELVIKNFGPTTVDISDYRLYSMFTYTLGDGIQDLTVIQGNLLLTPGQTVTISGFSLISSAADLGLYYSQGGFGDTSAMIDFVQWGSGGNGRESVAVSKGIWTGGDYLDENPAFIYIGDGDSNGLSQWTDRPTVCGNGEVQIGQACDDGNTVGGDGCSADCLAIESGRTCPMLGGVCTDDNECAGEGSGNNCAFDATCSNIPGSFSCTCNNGYSGDGVTCTDDNECLGEGTGNNCSADAVCSNILGSFSCTCSSGYSGDGVTCADNNECLGEGTGNNCSLFASCSNSAGSFACDCNSGYEGDGVLCAEVCGNGLVTPSESCDDGNTVNGDGCSSSCAWEYPSCSVVATPNTGLLPLNVSADIQGISSWELISSVDRGDGSALDNSGLTTSTHTYMTTGVVTLEVTLTHRDNGAIVRTCETTIDAFTICGNDSQEPGEGCDDGLLNGVACDPAYNSSCSYCSSSCTVVTVQGGVCGDGTADLSDGEQCDLGTTGNSGTCNAPYGGSCTACNSSCQQTTIIGGYCDDGIVQSGVEECDDGGTGLDTDCDDVCLRIERFNGSASTASKENFYLPPKKNGSNTSQQTGDQPSGQTGGQNPQGNNQPISKNTLIEKLKEYIRRNNIDNINNNNINNYNNSNKINSSDKDLEVNNDLYLKKISTILEGSNTNNAINKGQIPYKPGLDINEVKKYLQSIKNIKPTVPQNTQPTVPQNAQPTVPQNTQPTVSQDIQPAVPQNTQQNINSAKINDMNSIDKATDNSSNNHNSSSNGVPGDTISKYSKPILPGGREILSTPKSLLIERIRKFSSTD